MEVFRFIIECEVEDDFDLVFGALDGIERFSKHVQISIELVEKIDPKESDNDDETETESSGSASSE